MMEYMHKTTGERILATSTPDCDMFVVFRYSTRKFEAMHEERFAELRKELKQE